MDKTIRKYLKRFQRTDYKIIVSIITLCAFGCVMVYSSSMNEYQFKKEALFCVAGIVVMLGVQFFDYRWLKRVAPLGAVASVICILLLKIDFLASTQNGATRWLKIGPITIQVAEVVKLFMILFLANWISKTPKKARNLRFIAFVWGATVVIAFMILKISSNLSTCLILCMIVFGMTFASTDYNKLHIGLVVAALLAVLIIYVAVRLNPPSPEALENMNYHFGRIAGWVYPEGYASGAGYQIIRGLYAIGSGGLLGNGLGSCYQAISLPEASNDMIFAVIVYEFGLVGAVLLLALYAFLFYNMLYVILKIKTPFGRLLGCGIWFHMVFQTLVNMMVSVNLIPNTGVSLPFISNGGSSMLISLSQIGLLLSVRRIELKTIVAQKLAESQQKQKTTKSGKRYRNGQRNIIQW